jgi:rhodanese-related sulfurtransferase
MGQESAKTAANLVADAKSRTENLTPDEVANEIQGGDAVLVDLREPEERIKSGTIPGAVHAPRGMLEFYADPTSSYHRPEFDPNRRTILHCASGGRSALAADTLRQLGYSNVAHMDGGINAWKESGHEVEEGDAS